LSFSYWIDNLGFITEGKLAGIFIKPSLGVSHWPVIYFINYMPTSFLAPSSPRHHLHMENRDMKNLATPFFGGREELELAAVGS
jgi:hypothetical protein